LADQGRPLDLADFIGHLLKNPEVFLGRQLGPFGVCKESIAAWGVTA